MLRRFPPFAHAAEEICHSRTSLPEQLTAQITAPVLFTYVWYVLGQAERMGLKRLYFLSESGNAMLEIAKEIAKVCPVSLELRYLYCSEAALLLPVLHRMELEEALSVLFDAPQKLTLGEIFRRVQFSEEQRDMLRQELVLPDETTLLSESAYHDLCTALRNSVRFRKIMMENSRNAHTAALGYLVQAGLTDEIASGVVHAGWTCAVQRYLRLLSDEIHPITGFYFALRTRPKAAADGVHHTWYFSADKDIGLRTRFSWQLFRCMCMPPHGRTIGYRETDGKYVPVLAESCPDAGKMQAEVCHEFAVMCTDEITYETFQMELMRQITEKLLTGLMYRPTAEEVQVFSGLLMLPDPEDTDAIREILRSRTPEERRQWRYGVLMRSQLSCKGIRRFVMQKRDVLAYLSDRLRRM